MRIMWGSALVAVVLAVAGCSGDADDTDAAAGRGASSDEAAGEVATDEDEVGAGGGLGGEAPAGVRAAAPALEVRVVRTAALRLAVEKGGFADAFRAASELARSLGGFVQSSSTSSFEEGAASGDVVLRVPVARFDDAMRRLGELGEVESTSEEGEDVTAQLIDLDARIRALRAEEDALNALMADATNVNEVLSVRSTAVGVRQEIEQLTAQRETLDDRAAFSTIHAQLHEGAAVPASSAPDDSWDLGDAWNTAADAAEAVVGGLLVGLGLALPLAPLGAVAWLVARRHRRRLRVTAG